MSTDNEDKLLDSSASEGEPNVDTPATTADEGSRESSLPETTAKTEAKPKPSDRESLIKSLTGKESEGEDDSEEDEAEVEEAAPKAETEVPVEDKAEEVATSKHDTSDQRSKAKQRFETLTGHNKQLKAELEKAKPVTQYGQSVLDFCKEAQLSVNDLGVLLAFGAELKRDKAAAKTRLKSLGLEPDVVSETVKEVPQELDDAVLDLLTTGDITPDGMKKLIGIVRTARTAIPAKPPAPAPSPAKPAQQSPAVPAAPEQIEFNNAMAKAAVDIDLKDAELASKYPADWPKLRPLIKQAMTQYTGTHPSKWTAFFNREVELAIAKIKRPAAQTQALRPTTTTPASKPPPNTRAALIAEITGNAR